jgi:hypothetical protein
MDYDRLRKSKISVGVVVHDSSKGVTYEVWIDVAYVFVRDVCHFVE